MSRAHALAMLDVQRNYEGARRDRRTGGWNARRGSANNALEGQIADLRDRSRDLVRNSWIGARTIDVLTSSIIGTGITVKAMTGKDRTDRIWNEAFLEWAESCDIEGGLDHAGQQMIAVRAALEGGDSLLRFIPRRIEGRARRVPLAVQVMEGDHIDHSRNGLWGGHQARLGVVVGDWGERQGFYLFRSHPGEWVPGQQTVSEYVSADQLAHLFRPLRPGQLRGVPILAPSLMTIRDQVDLVEAAVIKARVEACFAGFIETPDNARTIADVRNDTNSNRVLEEIRPGMLNYLQPGEKVTFAQPTGNGQFDALWKKSMTGAAVGSGLTYDQLTGDYSGSNYSSIKTGKIEHRRIIEQMQWLCVIPKMMRPTIRQFNDAAILSGILPDRRGGWPVEYVMPANEPIDPVAEMKADILAVRAGRISPQQFIESYGRPWRTVLDETAAFFKYLDDEGMVLDIDPRKVSQGGQMQPDPADSAAQKDAKDA